MTQKAEPKAAGKVDVSAEGAVDAHEEVKPAEEAAEDSVALPFRYLSEGQLQEYHKHREGSTQRASAFLASCMAAEHHTSDTRQSVRVDFAMSVLDFARGMRLTPVKTGVLFNIAQTVLQTVEDSMPFADSREVLRNLLIPLTVTADSGAAPTFGVPDVAIISKFFADGIYQHYLLHVHVFNQEQELQQEEHDLLVELPHQQPFSMALSEEDWKAAREAEATAKELAAHASEAAAEQKAAAAAEAQRVADKKEEAFQRSLQLLKKPATLEEAIERAVAFRVEAEKKKLEAGYLAEIGKLKTQLAALSTK